MTDEASTPGPVEAAFREWVTTLGALSPLQQAEAETLYRIAAELDLKTDRPAAAYGTLRRAISSTVDRLRTEKGGATQPAAPSDPNVITQDVVETARRAREERRSGA